VRTQLRSDAPLLAAVVTGVLLAASVPVALGAEPTGPPAHAAASLRIQGDSLEARAQRATLELYALEARLGRARTALAGISARRAEVERQRASAARQLAVTRAALRTSQAKLGEVLRALYEQGGTAEPLELVLGASSLDEALAGLDGLDRAAGQTAEIIEQASASRLRLGTVRARLARRAAELRVLAAAARAEAGELAAAVTEREAYIAGLRRRQELAAARIAEAAAQARAAAARTTAPVATASPAAVSQPPAATVATTAAPVRAGVAGTTLTVTSTGYVLRGRTASGMRTGPGVVAVDPTVIPLGTRMTVPGYGEAIAADTGGAVIGNTIDLWFATLEEAHRWGRRTVTITLR
jgi:cystine transport system substrate-binding protein